jgi:hypothetical protein
MELWARELREVIRNGGPTSYAHGNTLARDAANHVSDRALAGHLELSLAEALSMLGYADEFGYGAFARQNALEVVRKIETAEGKEKRTDGASAAAERSPTETPSPKNS